MPADGILRRAVVYRMLADVVVVMHLAFIAFVAAGPLLAWRWRPLVWAHLPALAWGAGTVAIGFPCPLTGGERWLRRLSGARPYPDSALAFPVYWCGGPMKRVADESFGPIPTTAIRFAFPGWSAEAIEKENVCPLVRLRNWKTLPLMLTCSMVIPGVALSTSIWLSC